MADRRGNEPSGVRAYARAIRRGCFVWRPRVAAPVAVYGCPRGGSTMLADVLRYQPGTWMIDEPFALFERRERMRAVAGRYLKTPPGSQFYGLNNEQLRGVSGYVGALCSPRPGVGGATRPRRGFVIDRLAMKILNAPALIDWLEHEHGITPLILVRHPGGQALSIVRQGWTTPLAVYCERSGYWEELLGRDGVERARAELRTGDPWRIAVTTWVFQSAPLFRAAQARPERMFYYEDTVMNPGATVARLADAGLIADRRAGLTALSQPSGSSKMVSADRLRAIESGDTETVLGSWRRSLTGQQLADAQSILDAFGVGVYRFDELGPVETKVGARAGAEQRPMQHSEAER